MYKIFIMLLVVVTGCKAPSHQPEDQTVVGINGQLSINGQHLLNREGEIVQLKGMSLFWSQWQPQFFNKTTVHKLKEGWNCTVVRAPLAVENNGYLENPNKELEKIERVIDAAIEEGVYVIVDWHDHHAENHLQEAVGFFTHIAKKYGSYPNIIYEIYNEPLDVSWSEVLKPYHQKVIKAIRQYDDNNIIVCGTPLWSQRVDIAASDPINKQNVAYTLHFYSGTHKEDLREKAKKAIDLGLPLFVTEYGTTNADGDGDVDKEETKKWWDFLNKHKISYCNWSVADKDEGCSVVLPGTQPTELDQESVLTTSGSFIKNMLLQ